jgi:aspartate aminotransferase
MEVRMLSKRASGVKPSPTLAIDAKAKAMAAEGIDVVNFGVGEPDFDTPAHVKDAAKRALDEGFTKYTPAAGMLPLKDAVMEKFRRDNGLSYARDEVMISCGAKHCLYNIAQALFDDGDEVLIPAPYWVSYPDQAMLNGAVPVPVPTREEDGFVPSAEEIAKRITGRTKALILNSPSNPTGGVIGRAALEKIAEATAARSVWIISDEIYEKLIYDGNEHVSVATLGDEVKKRTIVVNGLSKSHAMTGWRIGFAAGPKPVIAAMSDIQSQSTSNPTSIAQKAAVAALNGPQDFISMMRAEFDRRRRVMVEGLNAVPGMSCRMPAGAFYAFPNTGALYGKSAEGRTVRNSSDLALYLLESAGVALVPGSAFGDDGFIRLSYATSEANIRKGLQRMGEAVSKLK